MVRIYKDDAEKAGIYIDTIYGPYGGYVLNQSIHLPKRRFNKSDYEFLNSLEVKKEDKEKLKIITDKVRGVYFGSKLEKTEIEKDCKNYYNIISRAIKEKRKVKIKYYSYTKGETERIIHPLDMFLYQTGWGIAAFCELRNDLRHFELKRISYIELLDEKF
jgi:predicted DNA-binding transcriptional regulator YafY